MRSENISSSSGAYAVRITPAEAFELERRARIARAQAVGDLVADAILWFVRLPRRIAELALVGAAKQRV